MRIRLFFTSLIAIILFGCDNTDQKPESFIKLSDKKIIINASGHTKTVYVSSNVDWSVSDIPDWITVNIHKEVEKPMIEIIVTANTTSTSRDVLIEVGNEFVKEELYISQDGKSHISEITWYTFPVNSITSVNYTLGENQLERMYNITGERLFINDVIKDKIYLGNLINNNLNDFSNLIDYSEYTYNPVTVGSFVNGKAFIETVYPSSQAVNKMANEIINSLPNQNIQFNYTDKPFKYCSYRQLNLLGRGNLGINLDEIISDKSYLEKEMVFRNGFIYSYCVELFDIVMDYQEKIIAEELTDIELLQDMSYIKSINYGRTSFLVIETNDDENRINNVIQKVIKNENLNKEEMYILENLKAYYLYLGDNQKLMIEEGKRNVIMKFANSINNLPIIPLTFSTQSYSNHSVSHVNLNIVLQ